MSKNKQGADTQVNEQVSQKPFETSQGADTQVNEQVAELSSKINELSVELKTTTEKLVEIETENTKLKEENDNLHVLMGDLESEIENLQVEPENIENEEINDSIYEEISEDIKVINEAGEKNLFYLKGSCIEAEIQGIIPAGQSAAYPVTVITLLVRGERITISEKLLREAFIKLKTTEPEKTEGGE